MRQLGERLFGGLFHKYSLLGDKKSFNPHDLPVAKDLEDKYKDNPSILSEIENIEYNIDIELEKIDKETKKIVVNDEIKKKLTEKKCQILKSRDEIGQCFVVTVS